MLKIHFLHLFQIIILIFKYNFSQFLSLKLDYRLHIIIDYSHNIQLLLLINETSLLLISGSSRFNEILAATTSNRTIGQHSKYPIFLASNEFPNSTRTCVATSRSLFRFSLDRVTRLVRRVIPNNSTGLLVKGLHRVKSRRVKAEKSIDTAARIKRYQDGYLECGFLTPKRPVLIARPQEKRDQDEDYGFYDWKDENDHVLITKKKNG